MNFIAKNSLYLITAFAVCIAVYCVLNWSAMPILQRYSMVFFIGLVLHLWEEGRFPGGFTDLVTNKLSFTQNNPHFGELVTIAMVVVINVLPMFVPQLTFLTMAALLVGVIEVIAHVAAAGLMLRRPYSPGLATAVVVLFPISIWGIVYAVQNELMDPLSWVFAFLYMLAGLMLAQQIVVRASGMKYADFLRNVRSALLVKK